MSSGLFFDNKKYISAKEASLLTSYSKDYIGQLCRADKIDCKQIGRIWYVSEESILNYKNFPTTFSSLKDQYIPVEKKVTSQVPVFTSAPTQQKSESVKTTTFVKIVNFVKSLISPKVFDAARVYASSNYSPLRVVGTVAIALVMLVGALTVKDGIVAFADTSSQLAEIMPRVVRTVLARTAGLPEDISNKISSAPMTAYDEMNSFTDFYSHKLAVVYNTVGQNIFATANSSTEAIITFAKNPPLQIVRGINAVALGEKKIIDRTAVSTKNIALAVHAQTFAFISDSFGGVSDVRQSTQTLSASVAFAVNRTAVTPVDRAGVTVYEKVNSWFDRGLYTPLANIFESKPAIVNTVYVAQQVT
ncbi:MAG: trimeric autotransporter adhesin, partial [Patescibacteria group bacterium]|nr:trimeric autotransporter adhesin [Patescibacteria group bacterium]